MSFHSRLRRGAAAGVFLLAAGVSQAADKPNIGGTTSAGPT
jgi:hypothetical protein